jgi:hypothetical protein
MEQEVPMADPEVLSIFDLEPDEAFEARLDAEAEADIAAGRVVPHETVAAWLDALAKREKLPPPYLAASDQALTIYRETSAVVPR